VIIAPLPASCGPSLIINWTQISKVTLALPATLYVGMAVTANSTTATATAQFRDLQGL